MASFHGYRLPGPKYNQNVFRSNININPGGDRYPRPSFQRPPSSSYRPIQSPERFMHGSFQSRPQFPNFPETAAVTGFRSRMPPPSQVFRFNSPPPNQAFRMNSPPPQVFRMNSPPPVRPCDVKSLSSGQAFRMQSPSPVPRLRFSGHFERPFMPWNESSSFGVSNLPYEGRPQAPIHAHQRQPLQPNKKRKQKTREFRKLKEDTTEKPFSCDTCDRAFVTENELKDHLSQHIKCDHKNCMFEAHPKIVALHQKMQHDTGYADRISKLQDDAEIQKWREERKRRFPTAENIKKRKLEQAEKEARGEVLETKEFGKFKKRREGNTEQVNNGMDRRMQNRGYRRHNRRRNFQNRQYSRPFTMTIDSDSDSDSDSHITLSQFSGMSSLKNSVLVHNQNEGVISSCKQNLSEFESDHNVISHNHPDTSHADCNSSNGENGQESFLLTDDNIQDCGTKGKVDISSEKDNFEALADDSVCTIPPSEIDSVEPEVVNLEDSEDESPMVAPIMKSGESTDYREDFKTTELQHHNVNENKKETKLNLKAGRSSRELKKEHNNFNGLSNRQGHVFQARKSTILEKLLADDIRHERNVILQCIRHIVNNNFFGIGYKKS